MDRTVHIDGEIWELNTSADCRAAARRLCQLELAQALTSDGGALTRESYVCDGCGKANGSRKVTGAFNKERSK